MSTAGEQILKSITSNMAKLVKDNEGEEVEEVDYDLPLSAALAIAPRVGFTDEEIESAKQEGIRQGQQQYQELLAARKQE